MGGKVSIRKGWNARGSQQHALPWPHPAISHVAGGSDNAAPKISIGYVLSAMHKCHPRGIPSSTLAYCFNYAKHADSDLIVLLAAKHFATYDIDIQYR